MSYDYFRVSDTIDDQLRMKSSHMQEGLEWKITNMLPTKFHLYKENPITYEIKYLGPINPNGKLTFEPTTINDKDKLYVLYKYSSSLNKKDLNLFLAMPPFTFRSFAKDIKIGTITYESYDGHNQYQKSFADVSGIFIHNHLLFPINIYYKGNLVAQTGSYDGLTYLGGSSSTVFFDNDREGLKLGDTITIGYSLPTDMRRVLTFQINDIHTHDVHFGMVSSGHLEIDPDIYAYTVDRPVWVGLKYYRPTSRYNSIVTNPYAAF